LIIEFAPAPVVRRGTRWVQCRSVTTAFAAQKSGMPFVISCDILPFSITGYESRYRAFYRISLANPTTLLQRGEISQVTGTEAAPQA